MGTVGCRLIRELREVFVCQKSRRLGSRRDRRERSDTGGGRGVSCCESRRHPHRPSSMHRHLAGARRRARRRRQGCRTRARHRPVGACRASRRGRRRSGTNDRQALARARARAVPACPPVGRLVRLGSLRLFVAGSHPRASRSAVSPSLGAGRGVYTCGRRGFQKLQKFRRAAFAVSNQPSRWWWWNTLLFNCGARPTKRTRTAMAAGVTLCASLAYALYHPLGVRTSPGPRARSGAAAHAALSDSRS